MPLRLLLPPPVLAVKVVQRERTKETVTATSEACRRSLEGAVMVIGGQDTCEESD